MSRRTLELTDSVYNYLLSASLRESEIFQQLRQETSKLSNAQMQISPEQGQFMALLAQLINAKKALEIGVFTGYSALAVASVLPKDGRLVACDINKEWANIAQTFWKKAGVSNKIDLRIAPALETLASLLANGEANSFDFAFIDADKKSYDAYYEKVLMLVRPGGLIMIDNVLQQGRVAEDSINDPNTVAIRAFNKKLHDDQRIDISMIPISDGLTLARKRSTNK